MHQCVISAAARACYQHHRTSSRLQAHPASFVPSNTDDNEPRLSFNASLTVLGSFARRRTGWNGATGSDRTPGGNWIIGTQSRQQIRASKAARSATKPITDDHLMPSPNYTVCCYINFNFGADTPAQIMLNRMWPAMLSIPGISLKDDVESV